MLQRLALLLRTELGRQHASEAPVLRFNLIDNDVDVLWLLSEGGRKRPCDVFHDFPFLGDRHASLGDLYIHIRHTRLFCLTSKMSHDPAWRGSCSSTRRDK